MTPPDDPLQQLIGQLYEAAMHERPWSGLADDIAATFNAPSAVLKIDHADGAQVDILELTDNFNVAGRDPAWAEHWHRNDLWVKQSHRIGTGRVMTSQALMPQAELENSGFYQDWLRPLNIHSMVGAVFTLQNQSLGVIGIHRPKSPSSDFDDHDQRRLATLLPHLQRAFLLRQRMQQQSLGQQAAELWLDRSGSATFVVDAQGRLLHANRMGEALLRQGNALQRMNGRLGTPQTALAAELARQIQAAARTASGHLQPPDNMLRLPRAGHTPLSVLVAPLPSPQTPALPSQPLVVVFAHDPEAGDLSPRTLRSLFGLTPTEARIATALARGHSLEEAAAAQDIGIGTARTHLKNVLAKTDTHRQAELVSLLLRSVPLGQGQAGAGPSGTDR